MRKLLIVLTLILFQLNPLLTFGSDQGFFMSQSDYLNMPYEFIGYVSAQSTPNPYSYLQENMPQHLDDCVNNLIGEAKRRRANGILSLRWDVQLVSQNNNWYALKCYGMAIKIQ